MATKRLIDADELKTAMYLICAVCNTENIFIDVIVDEIDNADDVDAVEVVHGRWEWFVDICEDLFLGFDVDYGWRCSHCKTLLEDCDDPEAPPIFNYCPNCGAKMDGDGNA